MDKFLISPRSPLRVFISWKALLAIIFWGASFVVSRIALESFHPFGLVLVRLVIASTMLACLTWMHGQSLLPAPGDRRICTILGVILGVHLSIQAFGLRYTTAISSGWIVGFIPVTIAIAAHVFGKQRMGSLGWLGTFVGACGVLLVTMNAPPDFTHARWGDFLQMSSCLTWTAYTVLGGEPVRRNGALRVTLFAMLVAIVMLVPIVLLQSFTAHSLTPRSLGAATFLGICCSGLAFFWWNEAVAVHGPTRVGSLIYFQPFVTLAASVYLLKDETITWNAIVGGCFVLTGVWLIARGARTQFTQGHMATPIGTATATERL